MDKKELNASNFMPVDLLEIICILERREKHKSYKIIRKRNYFSLITKFPTKNGESTPLKNSASANGTATHQNKKEVSSDDKLLNKGESVEGTNLHMLLDLPVIWIRNIKILPMSD